MVHFAAAAIPEFLSDLESLFGNQNKKQLIVS